MNVDGPRRRQRGVRDGRRTSRWPVTRCASGVGPEQALAPVRDGRDQPRGRGPAGAARLDRATADLAEALAGAEVVIVPLPATSHDDLAKRLAAGSSGARSSCSRRARSAASRWRAAWPGPARRAAGLRRDGHAAVSRAQDRGRGGVRAGARGQPAARRVPGVAHRAGCWSASPLFPSEPAVRRRARRRADQRRAASSIRRWCSVNAASIDGGRFDIHAAGTTASARRLIDVVDAERVARGRAGATRRRTTSWRPTTTRRGPPRASTAPAPGTSSSPAASGARSSRSSTAT